MRNSLPRYLLSYEMHECISWSAFRGSQKPVVQIKENCLHFHTGNDFGLAVLFTHHVKSNQVMLRIDRRSFEIKDYHFDTNAVALYKLNESTVLVLTDHNAGGSEESTMLTVVGKKPTRVKQPTNLLSQLKLPAKMLTHAWIDLSRPSKSRYLVLANYLSISIVTVYNSWMVGLIHTYNLSESFYKQHNYPLETMRDKMEIEYTHKSGHFLVIGTEEYCRSKYKHMCYGKLRFHNTFR